MRSPDTVREARIWIGAGLAVVLVVLAALAVVQVTSGRGPARGTPTGTPPAPSTTGGPEQQPPAATAPRPVGGTPLRLRIPRLDIDATVLPVELQGDVLVPPDDVTEVGWWQGGAEPGARRGTALLAGHSWQGGDGVFDDLGTLDPGDRLQIVTADGRIDYVARKNSTYSTPELTGAAQRLFSQDVVGRLVVITCSDYYDGDYHANTVVVARPAPHQPALLSTDDRSFPRDLG